MAALADIGLIGLAVMGQNLALNIHDHGFRVAVSNRTTSKITRFLENEAKDTDIIGAYSPAEFIASIKRPRKIILMIQAGEAVDKSIAQLAPLLDEGDIIIDGGNSNFNDTIRRTAEVEEMGLLFVGAGISGGEEGARYGPSIMPGGSPAAWESVKPILQAVAAKVPDRRRPAAIGWAKTAPGISSKWCTTASNTAICSSSAKLTHLDVGRAGHGRSRNQRSLPIAGTKAFSNPS